MTKFFPHLSFVALVVYTLTTPQLVKASEADEGRPPAMHRQIRPVVSTSYLALVLKLTPEVVETFYICNPGYVQRGVNFKKISKSITVTDTKKIHRYKQISRLSAIPAGILFLYNVVSPWTSHNQITQLVECIDQGKLHSSDPWCQFIEYDGFIVLWYTFVGISFCTFVAWCHARDNVLSRAGVRQNFIHSEDLNFVLKEYKESISLKEKKEQ